MVNNAGIVETSILMDKQVRSKNLHIGGAPQGHYLRGVQFFYYFGVHRVRRNERKIVTTNKVKIFYGAVNDGCCDRLQNR
jgi:hypothetical protein